MEALESLDGQQSFKTSETTLRQLDPGAIGELVTAAADVALIVDKAGVVADVAITDDELLRGGFACRPGAAWVDTVTVESRPKIEEMVEAALAGKPARWRQVNHSTEAGPDIPVKYLTRRIGNGDHLLVVGRDLRPFAVLQQRLVETQQSMEREYARLRQAEMRYRLLFQLASEPVLMVNSVTKRVQEANPAALRLLGRTAERTNGRPFLDFFDPDSAVAVERLFAGLHATGGGSPVPTCLRDGETACTVSASLFRRDDVAYYLVCLALPEDESKIKVSDGEADLRGVMERLPDGFVVTDPELKILTCNSSFLDLVQLALEGQAQGENLERWLGRGSIDASSIDASLREHGTLKNFSTSVRNEYGLNEDVQITAVSVPSGETSCLGFIFRHAPRRAREPGGVPEWLPRSADQLTELVGRVPLKDLVREATDVIERLCIEESLQLTHDNRALAAHMLGLSRQSFYAKLHRHGLGDLDSQ